jgi:hypothetical protein
VTSAARATALALAVAAAVIAFALGYTLAYLLAIREPRRRPCHLKVASGRHRERLVPRHEWLMWVVNAVGRAARATVAFVRRDGGARAAVSFAVLFLAFSVAIGASQ